MRHQTFLKAVLFCIVMVLATQVGAQTTRRWGLYGDWQIKIDFSGRQMESILSFSRTQEGTWTGQWISFWGLSELEDVKYEEGQLSFSRSRPGRDGQTSTSKFTGKIEEGKLSGTLTSDRGESAVEGQRSPRVSRAVGMWEMKLQMGEREFNAMLTVKAGAEDQLSAEWRSERGELEISDVQYERRNLSFKMKSTNADRQWEAAFAGTISGDALSGTVTSERGEIKAEGTRVGAALVGTWMLDITSERGARKQRLRVNPDMTGMYGAIPIKKVTLEDGRVGFVMTLEFGDQSFEMTFDGKLEEAKLTGELKTARGASKITGTKVVRPSRRRPSQ
ncbi:MAG: hypothetical protein JW741_15680 [Sedimentisphaerales bacterium]|nr:hypothetical protein [Sedimentisphaerales bacterium]